MIKIFSVSIRILIKYIAAGLTDDVSFSSGNGLMLSGNKPLPVLMQTYVAIWHHKATMT